MFEDEMPNCGGSGEVEAPCSRRHRHSCNFGNPACDDRPVECPGCEDCEG
jgi:hypothetical protein